MSQKLALAYAAVLTASALLLGCNNEQNASSKKEQAADAEMKAQVTSFLKEQISSTLKDPSSAQFKDAHLYQTTLRFKSGKELTAGGGVLCGEINGKNSFGAYIGFRPFISKASFSNLDGKLIKDTIYTEIFDSDPQRELAQQGFKKNYAEMCRDKIVNIDESKK